MTGEKPVVKRPATTNPAAKNSAAAEAAASKAAASSKPAIAKKPAPKPAAARKAAQKKAASKSPGSKATTTKTTTASKAPAVAPAVAPVVQPAISAGIVLYLLRHADAGDPTTWTGDDAERPLSKKGRKQARRLGRHLDALGLEVGPLLTSPKLRAADTARLVGKAIGVKAGEDESLGGGFDPTSLRRLLGGLASSATSVVLVGHDPDFSTLASWLTDAPVALRKGALARIDLPNREAAAGSGALAWLLPPDAIRG